MINKTQKQRSLRNSAMKRKNTDAMRTRWKRIKKMEEDNY